METRRLVLVLTGVAVALVIVLGGLSLALFASGGGSSNSSSSGGSGTPGAQGSPLPDRVAGELRLFGSDPVTLDPACASDAESAQYIVELFSGLVSFDQSLKIIPDIAQGWDVSPDGTVYTFHLRPNVLFHDSSRRVTASDFKFSMERSLDPQTQSTVGDVYLDDIVGASDFIAGNAKEVTGIKVVDQDTLQITIKQASAFFLDKLTYPTAFVVDQNQAKGSTCFENEDWTQKPNGTGPFKMKNWVLGQRIELVPNTKYYLDPKPSVAQVTFVLAGGSAITMYQNNEIDVTGVGINDIESVRDPTNALHKEFTESDSMDVFYIGLNTKKAPFDNPKVRQALAMAVDKDTLANNILKGLVVPAGGVLPPSMPGFNKDLKTLSYNPDQAKQLLDEAGGPDLFKDVVLRTSGQGASPSQVLEAITAMWKQNLGIDVTIEQEDFGLFLRDLDQGNVQMFSLGWIADYPDPQNFLEIKFLSTSGNNETKYSNPQVDDLLNKARVEKDQNTRIQLYQQAEQLIVNDSPWVPLYHDKAAVLVKPYVKGFTVPPFVIPHLRFVSIQK